MAKFGSDDVAFLLIDGYSVLGVTTEISDEVEALTEETTPLGTGWPTNEPTGLTKGSLSQKGFFDDGTDSSNAALNGSEGQNRVLCYGVEGNTVGKKFVGFAGACQVNYKRIVSRGALHKSEAEYRSSGEVEEGVILHELSAEAAATGDTEGAESVDNSASSANGGAGYLQVSGLTLGGYTSLAVKIRHSADDVTYADLVAFTAVTAAPDAERKTVAGTVNRHLAMSWAYNGAGSGQAATFMAGFARS